MVPANFGPIPRRFATSYGESRISVHYLVRMDLDTADHAEDGCRTCKFSHEK